MNGPFDPGGCIDCEVPILRIVGGIAVFLVFALAARRSIDSEWPLVVRWIVAIVCIAVSLGGLLLSWYDW